MLRPIQGEISEQNPLGQPKTVIAEFVSAGSQWIHLVDLDHAFGRGDNKDLIASLIEDFDSVNFQLSGGISNQSALDFALSTGARRINLASQSLSDKAWLESISTSGGIEICFALDVFNGNVVARGTKSDFGPLEYVLEFLNQIGLERVSVTDVERDGMLTGPNLRLLSEVSEALDSPVISSGGVGTLEDLQSLVAAEYCSGAILGKALYTKNFSLSEAISVVS